MAKEQLIQYVATERARGVGDEALRAELVRTGWDTKDISEVMGVAGGVSTTTISTIPSDVGFFRRLFLGRIGRMRYFLGCLFAILPSSLLLALWGVKGYLDATNGFSESGNINFSTSDILFPILILISVLLYFIFFPSIAIRRLHDINMSGWYILVNFIPYIGFLFSLYILFAPGSAGANKYGPPPQVGRGFIAEIFNR